MARPGDRGATNHLFVEAENANDSTPFKCVSCGEIFSQIKMKTPQIDLLAGVCPNCRTPAADTPASVLPPSDYDGVVNSGDATIVRTRPGNAFP